MLTLDDRLPVCENELKILYIEDTREHHEKAEKVIHAMRPGWEYSWARHSEQAEPRLREGPDVVIIDQELAGSPTQGPEIAREVLAKRKGGWQPIVVLLTVVPITDTFINQNPLGDAYIEKNRFFLQPDVLFEAIEVLYATRRNPPEEQSLRYRMPS